MPDDDRFTWSPGDVKVVNPGVDLTEDEEVEFLISKIEAAEGDQDMKEEVVPEANAYMTTSQNVLGISRVRTALEKLLKSTNSAGS